MDFLQKGWFTEKCDLWPNQAFSLEVEKVLFEGKSKFQDVMVFKSYATRNTPGIVNFSKNHGTVLVLDGIIQCTEFDEFAYQEMISFLPLCAHPNPQKVLIVGGGDGGVAREVAKHPCVQSITQVEIDEMVIEVSKKYLPNMAKGFASPKLNLIVGDGFEYLKNHKEEFDVIITDSSDPIGPATNLFTASYFGLLKNALKPSGIICSQGGTAWGEMKTVKETMDNCRAHFPTVKYAYASVPTYPNGQIGLLCASLDPNLDLSIPQLKLSSSQIKDMELLYYSSEMHSAAFVLPNFIANYLK